MVYAVRRQREGETAFKLATASWFYKLFDKLAQVDLEPNSGDFRLLDRRALDALLTMTERSRFLRGMTVWVGFTQTAVPYERDARHAGETKYTLRKMLRFSLDAIASFSHLPLQLATYVGLLSAGLAFVAIPVVIGLRFVGSYLPGFGSLTIAILLLGGIQLIALGVIGEYVGRIYDEVKHRPLYIVRDERNRPNGAHGPLAPDRARAGLPARRSAGDRIGSGDEELSMEHRQERVRIETARHRIEGSLTLSREGYRSRVSDVLNASERDFLTLTEVDGRVARGGRRRRAIRSSPSRAGTSCSRSVRSRSPRSSGTRPGSASAPGMKSTYPPA